MCSALDEADTVVQRDARRRHRLHHQALQRRGAARDPRARRRRARGTARDSDRRRATRASATTLGDAARRCARVDELIDRIADADVPVLITGESGVGKDVVAREIHARSARARTRVRQDQLRGAAGRAARERALRPRARLVHRRAEDQAGPVRARRRRHPVPRRDRRDAGVDAGQAAAGAAGRRVLPRRRPAQDQGRHARHRRHQRRPGARRWSAAPSARISTTASTSSRWRFRRCASGARTSRGCSSTSSRSTASATAARWSEMPPEMVRALLDLRLSGQHPRAREPGAAPDGAARSALRALGAARTRRGAPPSRRRRRAAPAAPLPTTHRSAVGADAAAATRTRVLVAVQLAEPAAAAGDSAAAAGRTAIRSAQAIADARRRAGRGRASAAADRRLHDRSQGSRPQSGARRRARGDHHHARPHRRQQARGGRAAAASATRPSSTRSASSGSAARARRASVALKPRRADDRRPAARDRTEEASRTTQPAVIGGRRWWFEDAEPLRTRTARRARRGTIGHASANVDPLDLRRSSVVRSHDAASPRPTSVAAVPTRINRTTDQAQPDRRRRRQCRRLHQRAPSPMPSAAPPKSERIGRSIFHMTDDLRCHRHSKRRATAGAGRSRAHAMTTFSAGTSQDFFSIAMETLRSLIAARDRHARTRPLSERRAAVATVARRLLFSARNNAQPAGRAIMRELSDLRSGSSASPRLRA